MKREAQNSKLLTMHINSILNKGSLELNGGFSTSSNIAYRSQVCFDGVVTRTIPAKARKCAFEPLRLLERMISHKTKFMKT